MPERTMEDLNANIIALHRKILTLTEELAVLTAARTDQEAKLTVALADSYTGAGQEQTVAQLRADVARLTTEIAEKQSVKPILCERLQAARQVLRQITAREHSEAITKIESRQEAIRGELAALAARQAAHGLELEEIDHALRRHISTRNKATRRHATWRGPIEQLEPMGADPFAEIRPDEVQRMVAEWREQERQEGYRIRSAEVNYATDTGRIVSAIVTDLLTRFQVRDLQIVMEERARESRDREIVAQARR